MIQGILTDAPFRYCSQAVCLLLVCQPFCKARTDADVAEAQRDFSTFLQLLVNWRGWKMDLKTKMYLEAVLKIPFLLQKNWRCFWCVFVPPIHVHPTKTWCKKTNLSLPSNSITLPGTIKHIISLLEKGHRFWVDDFPAKKTRSVGYAQNIALLFHRGWWDTIGSCESRRFHGGATCCSRWNPAVKAGCGAIGSTILRSKIVDMFFFGYCKGASYRFGVIWLIPSLLDWLIDCLLDWLLAWLIGWLTFQTLPFPMFHDIWFGSHQNFIPRNKSGRPVRWRRQLSMIIPMVPCRLGGEL